MAVRAGQLLLGRRSSSNLMRQLSMAAHAVRLQNLAALRLNDDWLYEYLRGEFLTVSPAVFGLGEVLGNERFRQMTVDADGHVVVARLLPSVVLRLHDVAIHAGLRIL